MIKSTIKIEKITVIEVENTASQPDTLNSGVNSRELVEEAQISKGATVTDGILENTT